MAGRPSSPETFHQAGKLVAAICAAPAVLKDASLLENKKFTAHFSVYEELPEALAKERVVQDGTILTSRGAGTAVDFGLAVVRHAFRRGEGRRNCPLDHGLSRLESTLAPTDRLVGRGTKKAALRTKIEVLRTLTLLHDAFAPLVRARARSGRVFPRLTEARRGFASPIAQRGGVMELPGGLKLQGQDTPRFASGLSYSSIHSSWDNGANPASVSHSWRWDPARLFPPLLSCRSR